MGTPNTTARSVIGAAKACPHPPHEPFSMMTASSRHKSCLLGGSQKSLKGDQISLQMGKDVVPLWQLQGGHPPS